MWEGEAEFVVLEVHFLKGAGEPGSATGRVGGFREEGHSSTAREVPIAVEKPLRSVWRLRIGRLVDEGDGEGARRDDVDNEIQDVVFHPTATGSPSSKQEQVE